MGRETFRVLKTKVASFSGGAWVLWHSWRSWTPRSSVFCVSAVNVFLRGKQNQRLLFLFRDRIKKYVFLISMQGIPHPQEIQLPGNNYLLDIFSNSLLQSPGSTATASCVCSAVPCTPLSDSPGLRCLNCWHWSLFPPIDCALSEVITELRKFSVKLEDKVFVDAFPLPTYLYFGWWSFESLSHIPLLWPHGL